MTPKVISAVFILVVVGISSATGPTQPNLPTAPTGPAVSVGAISSATPTSTDTAPSGVGGVSTAASSNGGGTPKPVIPATNVTGTSSGPGSTDSLLTTVAVSRTAGLRVNQGGAGPSSSGTSGTPVNLPPGVAAHVNAANTGINNRQPESTGSSGATASTLPTSQIKPVVAKPTTTPPLAIGKNMTKTLPNTQKREPLNNHKLLRRLPKFRNQRIIVVFQEHDIPFLPGPLNEPPLSVSVFRTQPGILRKPPRLPRILRMRPL